MITFKTARIENMGEVITSKTILAAMAKLYIRYFLAYINAAIWFYNIAAMILLTCNDAPKRIVNRIVHSRKYALFTGYAKSELK